MMKQSRKQRKLLKEKECENEKKYKRRKEKCKSNRKVIDQEMNGMNTAYLSVAQIITYNPIMREHRAIKKEYLNRLASYLKVSLWHKREFESAMLKAYQKIILESEEVSKYHTISYYRYYILLDLIHVLGYEIKYEDKTKLNLIKEKYEADFQNDLIENEVVNSLFMILEEQEKNKYKMLKSTLKNPLLKNEAPYIKLILKNQRFKDTNPFGILVTATMSAGKSTFINALIGKNICLSQNMACTSKIHNIVNKTFEDGYSYEYDHDLTLTAGKEELMNDNELNQSDKIVVSTRFDGLLKNERIILNDSPGVNFSGDHEHQIITHKLIESKNYHLLIYIMNATQLGTDDESKHLEYVKQIIGEEIPILFVINKMDALNIEEENIYTIIQHQIDFLKKKGFQNPIVCPVSSKAGYLSKKFARCQLSRIEKRELYNAVDKFKKMDLPSYYTKALKKIKIKDFKKEERQLQKTCGLAYIEQIIKALITGGEANGTDLH